MLTTFNYPNSAIAERCEEIAREVQEVYDIAVRFNIKCRLRIGAQLNEARDLLGYGSYGEWLAWRLPEWSEEATRRWRVMAERSSKNPKLLEILEQFHSTTAAENYVCLPEPVQERVVEEEAYTWSKFHAITWDASMRERLADNELDHGRRFGDVLHAIEDAKDDPALQEVAKTLYQENRETFARLADREPAEMDVEVGAKKESPKGTAPSAQLVEGDNGLWLCRYDGEKFVPIAPIGSHLLMWNGNGHPSTLAAFPKTGDGPVADSWQLSVIDSACRRVNASTMQERYGEVL